MLQGIRASGYGYLAVALVTAAFSTVALLASTPPRGVVPAEATAIGARIPGTRLHAGLPLWTEELCMGLNRMKEGV